METNCTGTAANKLKTKKLLLGLLLDALGMLSFSIPYIGEFADVIWAPLSGYLMSKMYQGRLGKMAGLVSVLEEILPFSDLLPTFTLTWIYNYCIRKEQLNAADKKDL